MDFEWPEFLKMVLEECWGIVWPTHFPFQLSVKSVWIQQKWFFYVWIGLSCSLLEDSNLTTYHTSNPWKNHPLCTLMQWVGKFPMEFSMSLWSPFPNGGWGPPQNHHLKLGFFCLITDLWLPSTHGPWIMTLSLLIMPTYMQFSEILKPFQLNI